MHDIESLLMQNRLLTEEVKRRIDQLAAINTVAATVSQSLDLDRTLETALTTVLSIVGAEAGGISLIDEEAAEVVLRAQRGWVHDFVTQPMRIPLGRGASGRVILTNDVVVYNNLLGNEEWAVPSFSEEHFRSIAMAPMHARGKIIGILSIMSYRPNSFDDEIITVLRAIADTVGVALDNARLYETSVEHEQRLRAIVESTADGIIATDQNGRIHLLNHAAETMFNVKARNLVGTPLREAPIPGSVRDSLLFALSSRAEEHKSFEVTLENERIVSVMVSPVYVESQVEQSREADGWVIVLQDVTHLREAEIERARFMQAAAHDMRNPLGATRNSIMLLDSVLKTDDPTTRELIQIAISGANRLQDLIDDLLHLEHIQSGYGFNRTEVDIAELIREINPEVKLMMEDKSLNYTINLEADIPRLHADRRWISRALLNYLSNAAKYTPEGGSVELRIFVKDQALHIEVTDSGPGISAEAQSRLFERFYRAEATKNLPGTGLGLAIVKSVAEAHGGSTYVRSREGQGSTFGMTLPLAQPAAAKNPSR
jgi:two-component system phosphate regulon sensor histidine kinase PhoR